MSSTSPGGPVVGSTLPPGLDDDAPAPRQCGRCRGLFAGDPTLHQAAMPDWWLCPACRIALLGDRPRRTTAAGAPPPHGP
jgi:hypothetical protein